MLLKNEYARSASHIGLQSTKVIEKVDDSTIVFTGVWQPGGWAAALLAPRDVVIKRTWRCAAMRRDLGPGSFQTCLHNDDIIVGPHPSMFYWPDPDQFPGLQEK